jgi:uncharacterized protein (UPF0548 family)
VQGKFNPGYNIAGVSLYNLSIQITEQAQMKAFKHNSHKKRDFLKLIIGGGLATIGLASAWFIRRRVMLPIATEEVEVPAAEVMPKGIPVEATFGEAPIQLLTSGAGPLYVRSYQVDLENPTVTREQLFQEIVKDINRFSPPEMAYFQRTKGDEGQLSVGDEFFIHIVGPWNGPVRVINVTPTSFTFVTLQGHLEAGQITFAVLEHPERTDAIRFRIQSWARSSNTVTDLFYRTLGISRFAQTTMWTYFIEQVIEVSGGELIGKIGVMTHKLDARRALTQLPAWKRYSNQFDRWRAIDLNFDINKTEEYTTAHGWRLDDYGIGLPSEPPGEPIPNGSFEAARQVVLNYEFPDPDLITGIFVPDVALKDRIMILRARFLIFSFMFGVRIGNVWDELRDTEKNGKARVWGYSYRTLQGHFEMGEITFEVWKTLQTGEVRFRIHAYSKPDRIPNIFYRIGFTVFGRSLQVRFARTALARMQQLVMERLAAAQQQPVPEPAETPEVQPIQADEAAKEAVEEIQEKDAAEPDAKLTP